MSVRGGLPWLLCLVLWTPYPGAARAQGGDLPRLRLQQAVDAAIARHPVLRQAELDVDSAEVRVARARAGRAPLVNASGLTKAGLSGSATMFGLQGLAASPEPEGSAASANAVHDLLDFKRTRHESDARRAEVEHFEATVLAERSSLILKTKRAFWLALKATRIVNAAEQAVSERSIHLRGAESRRRVGLASGLQVREAETGLARTKLEVARAAESLQRALAQLNEAMGEASNQAYLLDEPAILPILPRPIEALVEEGLAARPELVAVEARIRAAEAWVRRARRDRYPRIMVMSSGGWTRFAELTLSRLLFGGFGIQLPLFTRGRVKATIEETRVTLEKTRAVRDELLRSVPRRIAEAHASLTTAIEALESTEQAFREAVEGERLAQVRHRHDLADGLEVAGARTRLAIAESEHAGARYDYKIAEAELDFATGRAVAP